MDIKKIIIYNNIITMKIILIAAISKNNIIGNNNKMIWKLPNDLKRFKKITLKNTIFMGRKTFESIGNKALCNRNNIVITTKKKLKFLNNNNNIIKIYSSLKTAFSYCKENNIKKIFIIGGSSIYKQTINIANFIKITKVHSYFLGDKKFPYIDPKYWIKTSELFYKKDDNHLYDYSFINYKRIINKNLLIHNTCN